jgi:arylsulfatase A-like enzyme
VPFIVRRPGAARAGTRTHGVAYHVDLAATIVDATGAQHPGRRSDGRDIEALAGKSLAPLVSGQADRVHAPEEPLDCERFGTKVLIQEHWKVLNIPTAMGGDRQWHLYDLSHDMAEQFPVEIQEPARFKAMIAASDQWAKANNVLSMPCDWNPYSSRGQ